MNEKEKAVVEAAVVWVRLPPGEAAGNAYGTLQSAVNEYLAPEKPEGIKEFDPDDDTSVWTKSVEGKLNEVIRAINELRRVK